MNTVINAWGGEGFLSAAAIILMGMMGMYQDALAPSEQMHLRVLDLAENSNDDMRRKALGNAYQKYYSVLFRREPEMVFDPISIRDITSTAYNPSESATIETKFRDSSLLSLGCTRQDAALEIRKGIYGKPWLGEMYYADVKFGKLYENFHQTELIIINCGGYRGGGTASTFIPLENASPLPAHIHGHRYVVVAGPATQFVHSVTIPYPEIYHIKSEHLRDVDIFDVEKLIDKLTNDCVSPENYEKHEKNIAFLKKEWSMVQSSERDLRNLNPKYYASRFLDRIASDSSRVSAIFINFKTDGTKLLSYDVNAKSFQPDLQFHHLNVISFINALCIHEIMQNHERYSDGRVYAFGTAKGDQFTPETMFHDAQQKQFRQFLLMSVIAVYYLPQYFKYYADKRMWKITQKWARTVKKAFYSRERIPELDNGKPDGKENAKFAECVQNRICSFINEYVLPVLRTLWEIDLISEQANFFPDEQVRSVIETMCWSQTEPSDLPDTVLLPLRTLLQADPQFGTGVSPLTQADLFLEKFVRDFPERREWNSQSEILDYADEVIGYAMQKAKEIVEEC